MGRSASFSTGGAESFGRGGVAPWRGHRRQLFKGEARRLQLLRQLRLRVYSSQKVRLQRDDAVLLLGCVAGQHATHALGDRHAGAVDGAGAHRSVQVCECVLRQHAGGPLRDELLHSRKPRLLCLLAHL